MTTLAHVVSASIKGLAGALVALTMVCGISSAVSAQTDPGYKIYTKAGKFDDVSEAVKDAILKRGFVVDYTGELNKMLERTAADTGTITSAGKKSPFKSAHFLQFCPAKLTHEAVNASPFGIANCPIAIFIFEREHEAGKIHVGYRLPVASPSKLSKDVNKRLTATLHDIATEATK